MAVGPFTGRDLVALEVIRARASGMGQRPEDVAPTDLVQWGFDVADAFVNLSTSRWAKQERSGDGHSD